MTEEVRELLRVRRKVRTQQDDNFAIFGPDSLTRLWNSADRRTVSRSWSPFLQLGLMVGGVGVMNIMLV